MKIEERTRINKLGMKLINYSYALEYADMGDMNDIAEMEERIKEEFKDIFEV